MGPAATLPLSARLQKIPLWQHVRQLFAYRELLFRLIERELKARYKNSALGFLWSLLNPLGMMLVFTFVFTVMTPNAQLNKYPIFFLCGYLPWQFFSGGVISGMSSIVANSNLVKKVYFPREVLPMSTALAALVNFLLALAVLFAGLLVTHTRLSPYIWLLPVVIFVQTCFVLGVSFFLSALHVMYRDTGMIMEIVLQAWFFLTPVFYPIEILPSNFEFMGMTFDIHRLMYVLNPMASLIAAYRSLLYWGYRPDLDFLVRTAVTVFAVLAAGYLFFLRLRARFAEEL
jgi:ABC-type polysaccharide/polyol phosphate export permease